MAKSKEFAAFAPGLVLLVIAVLINYLDRGTLSLAAPLLKAEWGISASQLGVLFSAFFWTYVALQFVVGWLVDRFNVNTMLAAGFLLWSLSMAGSGLAIGFASLMIMRLALGVGESVMFPAAGKLCAQHLPEQSRGVANAIIIAAIRWGSAIGTLGGGLLMAHYGWRLTFIIVGMGSLLWLPAWHVWKPASSINCPELHEPAPNSRLILRERSFWGAAVGHGCGNYLLYFLVSWLPYYLVQERHLSMLSMAGSAGLVYAIDSLSAIAAGWLADHQIRKGRNAMDVRKWIMGLGFCVAASGLVFCALSGPLTYWWSLAVVGSGCGAANSGNFAVGQTLAGSRVAGKWTGLQNGFANIAGIAGPPITGYLIDKTGHFSAALALTALVAVVGAASWTIGIRNRGPVVWPVAPEALV